MRARLRDEVSDLLSDPVLREPTRVLAALVANGTLDLKVALLTRTEQGLASGRIFHDKLGIFQDDAGNTVVFKGSMNETWAGLAADGNLESIDVAASWLGARDLERTDRETEYFRQLWSDRYPGLRVRPFPETARSALEREANPDWESTVASWTRPEKVEVSDPRGRTLRPHQAAGLASWRANGRMGILAFATGSGKTFTAIAAIREGLTKYDNVVLVVVPDQVLFSQWFAELQATLQDLDVKFLRAGAGHAGWRKHLLNWTSPGEQRRVILATVQTASTLEFQSCLRAGAHLFLVADEVHRLGSPKHRSLLNERLFGPRLGLSATPERAGDPDGTAALLSFFRGILEPRYSLADAVRDGVLSRYFYRPHVVSLSDEEHEEWTGLTLQIKRLYAMQCSGASGGADGDLRLQRLLLRRAKIVKQARAKVPLAVRVLQDAFAPGQRWIVYCEDLRQLEAVCGALDTAGFPNLPFHSKMEGDRAATLRWLDRRGGIVVAIRCLDEGVDVPSVTHALILASSKNPREYVQRRGRVLRRHEGKALAHVHDAIVVPPRTAGEGGKPDPVTTGELARALQFAEHADNPAAGADLRQIAIAAGVEWSTMSERGVEDVDD